MMALKSAADLPILQGPSLHGRKLMSITEIAATGLLRLMVPPAADSSSSELPESATRAIALAALQATTGMRSAGLQLPSQAPTAPPRNPKSRAKTGHKSSGDYR